MNLLPETDKDCNIRYYVSDGEIIRMTIYHYANEYMLQFRYVDASSKLVPRVHYVSTPEVVKRAYDNTNVPEISAYLEEHTINGKNSYQDDPQLQNWFDRAHVHCFGAYGWYIIETSKKIVEPGKEIKDQ